MKTKTRVRILGALLTLSVALVLGACGDEVGESVTNGEPAELLRDPPTDQFIGEPPPSRLAPDYGSCRGITRSEESSGEPEAKIKVLAICLAKRKPLSLQFLGFVLDDEGLVSSVLGISDAENGEVSGELEGQLSCSAGPGLVECDLEAPQPTFDGEARFAVEVTLALQADACDVQTDMTVVVPGPRLAAGAFSTPLPAPAECE